MVLFESSIPTPHKDGSAELTAIDGLKDRVDPSATIHDIAIKWLRELDDTAQDTDGHPHLVQINGGASDTETAQRIEEISAEQAEDILFGVLGAKVLTSLVSRAHFGPMSEYERSIIYHDALAHKIAEDDGGNVVELPITFELSEVLSRRTSTSPPDDIPPIAS